MIWHIFKKDWKLLWRWAAMYAAVQLGYNILLWMKPGADEGFGSGGLGALSSVLLAALVIGGVFLVATIAHQDAIPGVRQDWLVRPIARKHLLLAKVLSVLLMVHVPMLLSDLLYGLLNRFPIGESFEFALSRNILVLLVASLPLLAFTSLTSNLIEVIAGAFVIALSVFLFALVTRSLHFELLKVYDTTAETGLRWVPAAAASLLVLLAAIAVAGIQYFRRRTFTAGVIVVVTGILFALVMFFLPFQTAFAIEKHLSSQPGAGSGVTLTFDPSAGKFHRTPRTTNEWDPTLYLPVRVDGLPGDSVVRANRYSTRAIFASGQSRLISIDTKQDFHRNGLAHIKVGFEPKEGGQGPLYDQRLRDEPFRLEIEMSMTMLRQTGSLDFRDRHGDRACRDSGGYITTSYDDITAGEFNESCAPVLKAACTTLVLHDVPAPYVLLPFLTCTGDYKPYRGRIDPGGEVLRATAYIRDPAGVVRYPQGLEDYFFRLIETMYTYEPVDHFTKTLVTPNIRLKDWIVDQTPTK